MKYDQAVGEQLRKLRKEAGLRQDEVAELVGISGGAWGNKETGRAVITPDQLRVFCEFIEVLPGYVLNKAYEAINGKVK